MPTPIPKKLFEKHPTENCHYGVATMINDDAVSIVLIAPCADTLIKAMVHYTGFNGTKIDTTKFKKVKLLEVP